LERCPRRDGSFIRFLGPEEVSIVRLGVQIFDQLSQIRCPVSPPRIVPSASLCLVRVLIHGPGRLRRIRGNSSWTDNGLGSLFTLSAMAKLSEVSSFEWPLVLACSWEFVIQTIRPLPPITTVLNVTRNNTIVHNRDKSPREFDMKNESRVPSL